MSTSTPKWAVGKRRIAEGFYVSGNGVLEVDAVALCEKLGYPPTDANQEAMIRIVQQRISAQWPEIPSETVVKDFKER